MNSDEKTLMAGSSKVRRFGAAVVLFAALLIGACDPGPAKDGEDDGIGTSPSVLEPLPPPPDSAPRRAGANDPTGCPQGSLIVLGSAGNDVLEGSAADECFVALAGDDVIFASGNDFVLAGAGDDFVSAEAATRVIDAEDVVLAGSDATR